MRPPKVPVPAVDRANLNGAQIVALAGANSARRPKPSQPPIVRGPFVEAPAAITPTDRARKAVELALRHVDHAAVAAILAEFAPAVAAPAPEPTPEPAPTSEVVAPVVVAASEPAPAPIATPDPAPEPTPKPAAPAAASSTPSARSRARK